MEGVKSLLAKLDREVFVIVAGLAAAVGAFFVAKNYSLWILVPIPSAIAVVYHLLNLSSRYDSRRKIVESYQVFTRAFDETWTKRDNPASVSEDLTDDMDRHKPTFASILWGAALLTAVFAIPAIISSGGARLGKTTDPQLVQVAAAVQQVKAAANAAKPSMAAVKAAAASAEKSLAAARSGLAEWQVALVYSGFGVWVLIVMRTIGRANAGGLNARYLITASLRASAAMMLGFFAGVSDFFAARAIAGVEAGPPVYFLIGVFYPFFFELLRDEAYKVFRRDRSITDELPTTWIDGVDDDTQDILTEANVLSVQHLATADPGVLTVRTLFPFNRVLYLIDQAILVTYVRKHIVVLRRFGVRGVIDFVALVQPVLRNGQGARRKRSDAMLKEIADALGVSFNTVVTIGESVYCDYRVNLLMRLWQHSLQPEGYEVERPEPEVPLVPGPHIPITKEGVQSHEAFLELVTGRIHGNLRAEAVAHAVRFREENPDAGDPAAEWLDARFAEAYAIAHQRATVGASPKPGARAKEVYQEAFLTALGSD